MQKVLCTIKENVPKDRLSIEYAEFVFDIRPFVKYIKKSDKSEIISIEIDRNGEFFSKIIYQEYDKYGFCTKRKWSLKSNWFAWQIVTKLTAFIAANKLDVVKWNLGIALKKNYAYKVPGDKWEYLHLENRREPVILMTGCNSEPIQVNSNHLRDFAQEYL